MQSVGLWIKSTALAVRLQVLLSVYKERVNVSRCKLLGVFGRLRKCIFGSPFIISHLLHVKPVLRHCCLPNRHFGKRELFLGGKNGKHAFDEDNGVSQ